MTNTDRQKRENLRMDYQCKNLIKTYLTPEEHIIWKGQPASGHLFTKNDFFMIPFSLILCIGIIGMCSTLFDSASNISRLWCIPLICVGLCLISGRFVRRAFIRVETIYIITNKKILSFRKNQVLTFDYHAHLTRKVTLHRDGSGSIRFYSPILTQGELFGRYTPRQLSKQSSFVLDNIPDADRVFQILSTQSPCCHDTSCPSPLHSLYCPDGEP